MNCQRSKSHGKTHCFLLSRYYLQNGREHGLFQINGEFLQQDIVIIEVKPSLGLEIPRQTPQILFMAVSQEFASRPNAVLQKYLHLNPG